MKRRIIGCSHTTAYNGGSGVVVVVLAAMLLMVVLATVSTPLQNGSNGSGSPWMVYAQEETEDPGSSPSLTEDETSSNNNSNDDSSPSPTKTATSNTEKKDKADAFNVKDHLDWGTYYDPKNIFCGKFDCYRILGLDYEEYSYGNLPIDTKLITKRYRALSREWHPDKSKHRDAKERFVVRRHFFVYFVVCKVYVMNIAGRMGWIFFGTASQ